MTSSSGRGVFFGSGSTPFGYATPPTLPQRVETARQLLSADEGEESVDASGGEASSSGRDVACPFRRSLQSRAEAAGQNRFRRP